MNQVIICGTNQLGYFAYWDYSDKVDVLGFIDKDWTEGGVMIGTNAPIYPIKDIKKFNNIPVVLAENDEKRLRESIALLETNGFKEATVYTPPRYMSLEFCIERMHARAEAALNELKLNRSLDLGKFLSENAPEEGIKLKELTFIPGGSLVVDYALLHEVARKYSCKNYLEIGTYIGESINVVSDVCEKCFSITAGPDSPYSAKNGAIRTNIPDFADRLVYADNIKQLHCMDSKTFDFSVIKDNIDLYFIDGDHEYQGVWHDTRNVFARRSKDSIVIWHDFKRLDGKTSEVPLAVKDVLDEDEWKNVFCFDNNICGIYLPPKYQKDFSIRRWEYTKERRELYVYDTIIKPNVKP